MQHYKLATYIQLIFLFFAVTGCVKLKEDLTGQPTTDKFFKSAKDFNSFMAGAYAPLTVLSGGDYPYVAGAGAEDVHTLVSRWKGFEEANINSVSNPNEITDQLWNAYFSSLSVCNNTLKVVKQSTLSADNLMPVVGEAKFIRALNYFYLVRWFGEIPILNEDNFQNAGTEPQSSIASIYDFIISDIKDAETYLPESTTDKSKPNKWTAKALLAKVYLTKAGFPLNAAAAYTLARDKAKEIIDANIFSLSPDFRDLWLWNNRLTNPELMFVLYANSNTGTGSWLGRSIRPWDHGEQGWGDWESDKRFLGSFPAGDSTRVNGTFYLTMIDGAGWEQTDYAQPYVGKYRDGGPKTGGYAGPPNSNLADGFYPVLRYADILLTYAESANKAEASPSSAAYNAFNKVRQRAGLPALSGLSSDAFDKAVVAERNWELAFENNRWFDIYRKHILKEVVQLYYPHTSVDDHNYLLPKPTDQLSIMKGINQNPGY